MFLATLVVLETLYSKAQKQKEKKTLILNYLKIKSNLFRKQTSKHICLQQFFYNIFSLTLEVSGFLRNTVLGPAVIKNFPLCQEKPTLD